MVIHHSESTSDGENVQPLPSVAVGRARDNFEAALAAEGITVEDAGRMILKMLRADQGDDSSQN